MVMAALSYLTMVESLEEREAKKQWKQKPK